MSYLIQPFSASHDNIARAILYQFMVEDITSYYHKMVTFGGTEIGAKTVTNSIDNISYLIDRIMSLNKNWYNDYLSGYGAFEFHGRVHFITGKVLMDPSEISENFRIPNVKHWVIRTISPDQHHTPQYLASFQPDNADYLLLNGGTTVNRAIASLKKDMQAHMKRRMQL